MTYKFIHTAAITDLLDFALCVIWIHAR